MSFTTSKAFTIAIENIAKEKKLTHMDAVLYYCEKEGIEPDSVGSLVSKGLKEKIEANARELNEILSTKERIGVSLSKFQKNIKPKKT